MENKENPKLQPERKMSDTFWKNRLQEICQKNVWNIPTYQAIDHGLQDITQRWEVICSLRGQQTRSNGRYHSKKIAEQKAAEAMVKLLECKPISYPNIQLSIESLPKIDSTTSKRDFTQNTNQSLPTQVKQVSDQPSLSSQIFAKQPPRSQIFKVEQSTINTKNNAKTRLIKALNEDGLSEPQILFTCKVILPNGKEYVSEEYSDPKRAEQAACEVAFEDFV